MIETKQFSLFAKLTLTELVNIMLYLPLTQSAEFFGVFTYEDPDCFKEFRSAEFPLPECSITPIEFYN